MTKKTQDKYKPRKDGRYSTQVFTGVYTDDGKPIRETVYAKSSSELEKKVAELNYEIEHGLYGTGKNTTFGEYAEHWLSVAKATKSLRTNNMYKNILKNHLDLLKHRKIKDITKSMIQAQINECMSMPRLCQQLRVTIKQIFEMAYDDGLITRNPCTGLELPKNHPKENRPLTSAEKKALKVIELSPMQKAFVYILYGCGVRPGELFALTKKDIDLKNHEITINKSLEFDKQIPRIKYPKTNNGIRTIQAPTIVFKAISDYIDTIQGIVLFPNENGEYGKRGYYYNIFEVIRRKIESCTKKSKISEATSRLTMYTFRHNYCTELYYSGISMKECQRLMGHADYSMIMKVYSHLDEKKEKTKEKIEKLAL
ncbi:MAG: tyrosine-type recombinase/integrase [Clostridiales bacterium]|nr:tyrosine-type recombinase/integrase [Clostridiales bacterium]